MDVNAKLGTVYVLDDDPGVRDSLSVLIEAAGYRAKVFASGRDLLAQSSALSDGCLLLDISLPSESGIDVFHRLRAEGVRLPVIFMTGQTALMEKAAAAGDDIQVLEKPMSHLSLLRSLHAALHRDRAWSSR
jgi:FixJ family two-component response regulator